MGGGGRGLKGRTAEGRTVDYYIWSTGRDTISTVLYHQILVTRTHFTSSIALSTAVSSPRSSLMMSGGFALEKTGADSLPVF